MPKGFHGGLVEFIEIFRKAGKSVAAVHHGEALGHAWSESVVDHLVGIRTNGQEPHEAKVGSEGHNRVDGDEFGDAEPIDAQRL
jgi:hypothetical protein